MKKAILAITGFLIFASVWPARAGAAPCTKDTWRQIAELYSQAVCYPDQFSDFLARSASKYPPGGPWQKCAEQLGNALLSTAQSIADRRQTEEIAYGVAARAGAPEFGGQVADSMNQTANSPAMLGYYLLVVLQSTAQIQAGNAAYFASTDVYQIASQAWRLAAYAMGPEQMEKFRKVVYEATVAIIAEAAGNIIR